jgi:hypothetical protein
MELAPVLPASVSARLENHDIVELTANTAPIKAIIKSDKAIFFK